MARGALYFSSLGTNPRGVPKYEYLIATFIPIWSGLAYVARTLGQGKIEITGQITHYAHYIDWIVTTPLLLLSLSLTAMYFIAKDWILIASLMGTQAIVVVSGLIADLSTTDEARFLWYTCGVVAFLVVLWGIWVRANAYSGSQNSTQVVVVPASLEPFRLLANFCRGLLRKQVKGNFANQGDVLGGMPSANTRMVLPKRDI